MTSSSDALNDLLESVSSLSLSQISGKTLTLNSHSYDCNTQISFSTAEKSFSYSLISLFLQLQNPSINFIEYKKLCKEYYVKDFVKVTEKKHVFSFFLKDSDGSGRKVRISADDDNELKDSDKATTDRDRGRSSQKDRHSRPSKSKRSRDDSMGSAKKKEKKDESNAPITHEQLLQGLETVVDKRAGSLNVGKQSGSDNVDVDLGEKQTSRIEVSGQDDLKEVDATAEEPPSLLSAEEEEHRAIQSCLSAAGYEASNFSEDVLEKDRIEVEKITNFEIPVGDSATILRCGALSSNTPQTGGRKRGISDAVTQKNFKRVLELFEESKKEEIHKLKHGSKSKHVSKQIKAKVQEKVKPAGNPIIIVPNAMTSPITLVNSYQFFKNATFLPRGQCQRLKESSVEFSRNVSNRLGGGLITFEVLDNPKKHLKSPSDWARVVAVIAQGQSWHFKGWRMGWSDTKKGQDTPVEVFSNCFGFYVGFEGAPVPQELKGWNVKKGFLSKDKRGLDSVVFAQFWNQLEEYLSVKKPEFLPR